jgi:hypothetical protein
MLRGVSPIATHESDNERTHVRHAQEWLFANGLARSADRAVLISASPESLGNADTLRVVTLNE